MISVALSISSLVIRPRFFFNRTPSVPRGIYQLKRLSSWQKGMMVLFRLPARLDAFAKETKWLRPGGLLIKQVGALPGDWVCVDEGLFVNGEYLGEVRERTQEGNLLPRVEGCFFVPAGSFLPVGEGLSFDGRYFGLVGMGDVLGEGVLVVGWS